MSRRSARRAGAGAVIVALLVGGGAPATAQTPPAPPPIAVDAPAGRIPGPAPGLRRPTDGCPTPVATPPDRPAAAAGPAARLGLAQAHRFATGRGQVVAVIDTGVAPHPLLGGRLRGGGDFLDGGDGRTDCDGHGTAVAGLVAAARDPGDRMFSGGMAPDAEVLTVRQSSPSVTVDSPDGPRPAGDTATLAEAVVLAVRAGADVINISETACVAPERAGAAGASLQAAVAWAARSDVLVVAAAGNLGAGCAGPAGGQVSLPGWYDQVLTVGATEPDDAAAEFSVPGPWVDVAAPGSGLRSLAVGGGTTTTGVAGTSFAAPWVAGLAALVRERFPALTASQVRDRIVATARRPAGGHDPAVGAGVIDPVAALTAVPEVLVAPGRPDRLVGASAPLPGGTGSRWQAAPSGAVDLAAVAILLVAAAGLAVRWRRSPS